VNCGSRYTRVGRDRQLARGLQLSDERGPTTSRGRGGYGAHAPRGGRAGSGGPAGSTARAGRTGRAGRVRFEGVNGE
jgi:hypothetical protein